MPKKNLTQIIETIPSILGNVADWIKNNFEENAQDILKNSSGTIGICIKLLGTPLINTYFKKVSENRLKEFGTHTYIRAAYKQAANSIEKIEAEIKSERTIEEVIQIFSDVTINSIDKIADEDIILIYQPEYHPMVIQVKNNYVEMLSRIQVSNTLINSFKKDFNDNIAKTVELEFGDDYEMHLAQISDFLMEKNEVELLWDTIKGGKIGFEKSEDLKYETTYGHWQEIHNYNKSDNELNHDDEFEKKLVPVRDLIEQYFEINPTNHLEKILFLIADFGKGKSVFLKRYASKLAKSYIKTSEGYFPIYFNLRNFHKYQQNTKLGVISDYLLTRYAIDIESEYFKNKKYVFLIDSLDESGELNKNSIESVVNSIKQIQGLDKTKFRTNRIIITSRPFSEGLDYQLRNHQPFCIQNENNRDVEHFISLYGFKKEQFNDWIINTLKSSDRKINSDDLGFVSLIYKSIEENTEINVYEELLKNGTLTSSELRRPIFAYMVYQLILNNIDFLRVGKIGIYLSFLNLLSKEAKHIKDPDYKISFKEEFEFRNMLHATAALWMFERHKGNQGFLNKADLCRVLDGVNNNETDIEILERYKNQGVVEIEFLSHSYFGENDNTLHFQHQSFAEILLAEYYLKVFIKYSLDEDTSVEDARAKLILGIPTAQTIDFFIELLRLFLESSNDVVSEDIIEKRKLLFPLLASTASKKNNNLFCNDVYYEWYKKCSIDDFQSEYPMTSLDNWYLTKEKLNKINILAAKILNSKSNFLLAKAENKSSLYNNELLLLKNDKLSSITNDIDRWLALLVGNTLHNDYSNIENPRLFNTDYKINSENLFELINNLEYSNPDIIIQNSWRHNLFNGINMEEDKNLLRFYSVFNHFDFSYSYLKNIDFSGSLFGNTNFSFCKLVNIHFSHSYFWKPNFTNIILLERVIMRDIVVSGVVIPNIIVEENQDEDYKKNKLNESKIFIPGLNSMNDNRFHYNDLLCFFIPLIDYYESKNGIKIDSWFNMLLFEDLNVESKFKEALIKKITTLPHS